MADVKLLASQRLTDNPDGGGLMTSTEIVDGVVNNLWPDVSRVDRVYGVVNLRKLFCKADTPDTAIYSGLHIICLMPPQDPRVAVTIYTTNSWTDVRTDAQSAVERYLDPSVPTRMIPFDRQLAGQRTILVYQRPELNLPSIGEVYVLTTLDDVTQQFVRVNNLDHSAQTFTDPISGQDFKANVITLTISEPLQQTFQGSQPNKFFTPDLNTSRIRKTIPSDATNYHTVHALATDAAIGDLTVKLDSVFAQLIPASTTESQLLDVPPSQSVTIVPSGTAVTVLCRDNQVSPVPVTPGSVTVAGVAGLISGTYVDDSAGNIILQGSPATKVGTVDYLTGQFTTTVPAFGAQSGHIFYGIPAVAVSKLSQTLQQPITQSTRGYVYNATLRPIPTPGNLQVSFRALGKWYVLGDDGSGALSGDIGVGTGSVNFLTGTVAVSLGALPDIGSSIIYSWGGDTEYEIRTTDVDISTPVVIGTLTNKVNPGSVTVTWTSGGVTKTAADSNGLFTGDATGDIVYAGDTGAPSPGSFRLKPTLLPDPTTVFSVAYSDQTASAAVTENFTPSASGGTVTVTATNHPMRPGSASLEYYVTDLFGPMQKLSLYDDGNGHLVNAQTHALLPSATINYTTGVIVLPTSGTVYKVANDSWQPLTINQPARTIDSTTGYYSAAAVPTLQITGASSGTATWTYDAAAGSPTVVVHSVATGGSVNTHTETFSAPPISVDLTPLVSNQVVPGGVMFTLGGRTYVDRAGSLYYNVSAITNAGSLGGSIDYGTGFATITSWVGGASSTLSLLALLTQVRPLPCYIVTGNTPGSPLRPQSFYLQANQLDGTFISATADVNGNIDTSAMHGYVDVTTGVFSIAFGHFVLDSSLTSDDKAEPWYDSGNVQGDGYIWRPKEVIPTTITYNAVVDVPTSLDSTILGIDPVRLPLDGRVQAVRNGFMLILHDSQVYTMPGGLTAGQVVTLPRDTLALVEVRDQTGSVVVGQVAGGPAVMGALYTADLAAGTITMATPLDLSAFTQPLVATHRIEDASVVTDVQITGQVSFSDPLTHAYTASNSLASTALIAPFVGGSVQAAYNHLFTQQTWDNAHPNWTDAVIGSGTTANFDDLDFPIQVLNSDAITEKWALVFTSPTAFNIVAQDLGVIGTGNTASDVLPINPGVPGAATTTSATFSVAAVGSTQTAAVVSTTGIAVGSYCKINDATHALIGYITAISGSNVTVQTSVISSGAAGNTMASGATFAIVHPYFVLDHRGFGSGWAAGNAIRFDTQGAGFPVWLARTIKRGPATYTDDRAVIEPRWDKS